jgi:hypothetical protein
MNGSTHLSAWVSLDTKQRFAAMAQHAGLSESALLKRMVELTIRGTQGPYTVPLDAPRKVNRDSRLYVRLRPEDHLLLRERAVGRGMAAATYISMLVRAHLRGTAPIPDREMSELRRSVTVLGEIARQLHSLTLVTPRTVPTGLATVADLHALLRACEGLRTNTKALIAANVASWEAGNA